MRLQNLKAELLTFGSASDDDVEKLLHGNNQMKISEMMATVTPISKFKSVSDFKVAAHTVGNIFFVNSYRAELSNSFCNSGRRPLNI